MSLTSDRLEDWLEWSAAKLSHSQDSTSHSLRPKRPTKPRTKVSKPISAIRSPAEQRPLRTNSQHPATPAPRSAPKRKPQPRHLRPSPEYRNIKENPPHHNLPPLYHRSHNSNQTARPPRKPITHNTNQPSPPPQHSPQRDESEAQPLPLFRMRSGIPKQRLYVLSAREVYLTQRIWKGCRCVYLQAPRSTEWEVSVHK